jgi:hypothetical protein
VVQRTSGTATLAGGMLSPSPVSFSLVTANCCGYPNNPPSQFTGWRAGDGTDDFNFNVNYPIDTNGIVFESGPWGAAGTYVFGIYSNGSGGYEADLFGPGGANNYYTVGAPISLTVAAVPEPSTWALMVVGFLGLGGASYFARRRQTAAACPALYWPRRRAQPRSHQSHWLLKPRLHKRGWREPTR